MQSIDEGWYEETLKHQNYVNFDIIEGGDEQTIADFNLYLQETLRCLDEFNVSIIGSDDNDNRSDDNDNRGDDNDYRSDHHNDKTYDVNNDIVTTNDITDEITDDTNGANTRVLIIGGNRKNSLSASTVSDRVKQLFDRSDCEITRTSDKPCDITCEIEK